MKKATDKPHEFKYTLTFGTEKTATEEYIPQVTLDDGKDPFMSSWPTRRFPTKKLALQYAKVHGTILARKIFGELAKTEYESWK